MNVSYPSEFAIPAGVTELQKYFSSFVLPKFGLDDTPLWGDLHRTGPDNLVYEFSIGDEHYALLYDDYYPGAFDLPIGMQQQVLCADGSGMLRVEGRYYESVIGSFRLYKVLDVKKFQQDLQATIQQYDEWRSDEDDTYDTGRQSMKMEHLARDILTIMQSAERGKDSQTLEALRGIVGALMLCDAQDSHVDMYDLQQYIELTIEKMMVCEDCGVDGEDDDRREYLEQAIFKQLSVDAKQQLENSMRKATQAGQVVRFVTAMYAKSKGGDVQGVNVAFVLRDNVFETFGSHFLNTHLSRYFSDNPIASGDRIESGMPETLADYRLVQGSVEVSEVFEQELGHIQ